jgi:hypothetical protein
MLSHTLQFAVLLATFTNLTQHTAYICWSQRRHQWSRFGPAYVVGTSTLFIMCHPTYLVLKVAHKAYALTGLQRSLLQGCTILGYVLLAVGITWATGLLPKVQALCCNKRQDSTNDV